MVISLFLLQMFENSLEEGQPVLAESPKMATATPVANLKAETRPLFPRGLPYSPSPFIFCGLPSLFWKIILHDTYWLESYLDESK